MARGWESKAIEAQQEDARLRQGFGGQAARTGMKGPALSADDLQRAAKRRTLELARTHAESDLSRATAPAHRKLLEQTLAAIDEQLRML